MHKITVTDKYNLHRYIGRERYELVGTFDTPTILKKYVENVMKNAISLQEIDAAVNFMGDTTHNTAEFGNAGYFTVSYYDDSIEE